MNSGDYYGALQQQLAKLPPFTRALVCAIALVAIVSVIPATRKYAVWVGGFVLVIWSLKLLQKGQP